MNTRNVVLTVYKGDRPRELLLEHWRGTLDRETKTWLESQGVGSSPDVWVTIADRDRPAPDLRPMAQLTVSVADGPTGTDVAESLKLFFDAVDERIAQIAPDENTTQTRLTLAEAAPPASTRSLTPTSTGATC